jgi:hypothetical protein
MSPSSKTHSRSLKKSHTSKTLVVSTSSRTPSNGDSRKTQRKQQSFVFPPTAAFLKNEAFWLFERDSVRILDETLSLARIAPQSCMSRTRKRQRSVSHPRFFTFLRTLFEEDAKRDIVKSMTAHDSSKSIRTKQTNSLFTVSHKTKNTKQLNTLYIYSTVFQKYSKIVSNEQTIRTWIYAARTIR